MNPFKLGMATALSLLGLALSACQNPAYEGARSAQTATLTFVSAGLSAQPFVCVPERGFLPTRQALTPARSGNRKTPVGVRVHLTAGREQVIGVRQTTADGVACEVSARFTPETDGRYRARFLRPGEHCALAVLDANNRAVASGQAGQWQCP